MRNRFRGRTLLEGLAALIYSPSLFEIVLSDPLGSLRSLTIGLLLHIEDTSEIRICQILYILPDIYMPFTHCLLQKEKNPQLSFESCKILTRGLMEAYHLLSVRYMQLILLSLFKGTLPLDFPQEYYKVDTMCFLIFRKRNRD